MSRCSLCEVPKRRTYAQADEVGSGPGGYLVQKTLLGCAANMGSKISLLVYE